MSTIEVAKKLVSLCREGKNDEAISTLYADDVVSIEAAPGTAQMPREMNGIEALRAKAKWFFDNHEIHGGEVYGPYPHDNRFIVLFTFDVTPKVGPNAGHRITMEEAGLYTVEDDKIVHEEFFYMTGEEC